MTETKVIICKVCEQPKVAILAGKFDNRNKKWVDEEGKAFNGLTCSSCNSSRVKNNMKKLRFDRKQETKEE